MLDKAPLADLQLLTTQDIARMLQAKPETVIRLAEEGEFPQPVIDRYRFKRWHPDDITKWLQKRRAR